MMDHLRLECAGARMNIPDVYISIFNCLAKCSSLAIKSTMSDFLSGLKLRRCTNNTKLTFRII